MQPGIDLHNFPYKLPNVCARIHARADRLALHEPRPLRPRSAPCGCPRQALQGDPPRLMVSEHRAGGRLGLSRRLSGAPFAQRSVPRSHWTGAVVSVERSVAD